MTQTKNKRLDKWRAAFYNLEDFRINPEDYLAHDVIAVESEHIDTGLLDADGKPILRPRRGAVGFVKF